MNNYKHFGELLEQLRLTNHMTQSEAAEGICTLRQYSRLEKGESTPRIDILYGLSAKYNTNLYEYYNIHFCHQSFEAFHYILKLNETAATGNVPNLALITSEMEQLKEFESGDNYKYLCYARALTEFYKPNPNKAIEHCLKGLNVKDYDAFQQLSTHAVYTNIELCLMNCLGCSFIGTKTYKEADFTLHKLIEILDYQNDLLPFSTIKSVNFFKNLYENTVYNIAVYNYHLCNFDEAIKYAQKGIDHSIIQNDILYLPSLLQIKAYSLMRLDRFDEARKCSQQAIVLFELNMDACLNDGKPELNKVKYDRQKKLLDELNSVLQSMEIEVQRRQEEQAAKSKNQGATESQHNNESEDTAKTSDEAPSSE